jgi:hypothetical protein
VQYFSPEVTMASTNTPTGLTNLELLGTYLSETNPFGPVAMEDVREEEAFKFLYDDHVSFDHGIPDERSLVILGRRGAGKTSLLNQVLMRDHNLVITLQSFEIFGRMTKLANYLAADPESLELVWEDLCWVAAITQLARGEATSEVIRFGVAMSNAAGHNPSIDDVVVTFVELLIAQLRDSKRVPTTKSVLTNFFIGGISLGVAKSAAIKTLQQSKVTVAVLLDSIERFTEVNISEITANEAALQGLMRLVGTLARKDDLPMIVRCCFPSELYPEFRKLSTNKGKDLTRTFMIRWRSRQIVELAARRFCKFAHVMAVKNPSLNILPIFLAEPQDYQQAKALLGAFFDGPVVNRLANHVEEPALLYVMRHTQLVPRQYLNFMSAIVKKIGAAKILQGAKIPSLDVAAIVTETERELWREVVEPHAGKFSGLEELFEVLCKELPITFDRRTFESTFKIVPGALRKTLDWSGALNHLLAVGAVGGVQETRSTLLYEYGEFAYVTPEYRPLLSSQMCLHPLFSETGGGRRQAVSKPIFPIGSDE